MGQEGRDEFQESLAPVEPGTRTMGNSLYKAVFKDHAQRDPLIANLPGQMVKYHDRQHVKVTGDWVHSTYLGGDYLHDGDTDKGTKSVAFDLPIEQAGRYDVYLGYIPLGNRAAEVPVRVEHADGEKSLTIDQRSNVDGWRKLGTFRFAPDRPARVTVSNAGTDGYVLADSVGWVTEGVTPERAEPKEPQPVPFVCPDWAYQWKTDADFEPRGSHVRTAEIVRPDNFDAPSRGRGRNPGDDLNGAIHHAWWVEYGGTLDTIEDAERIRDELFRISLGLWNYAKNYNPKTVERNMYRELVWLNYVPGVRESRRLVGDYIMSQRDYDEQIIHPDTIAFTDWGSDLHHPEGFWVRGNDCIHVFKGRRTSIPYRTLYSKNVDNLFMAGRCHSATHVALGGTRVMRPMCATGQAAGTAAAIAHQHGTTPRGVYQSHLAELQQTLLKDGCYLLGVENADPQDLALVSTATASSAALDASAGKVNNGWNRVVGDNRNAWAPDPAATGPQWVQLELPAPTRIDTVHVTFERQSADCELQFEQGGDWTTAARIAGSEARRTVCRFTPVETSRIRLLFDKPSAQTAVCEIRVYCEGSGAGE
jgi:hypothetical protein